MSEQQSRPLTHQEFYRKAHKPVSEATMLAGGPEGTICGVLRELYLLATTDRQKELLRLATAMAKHMGSRLNEYKRKQDGQA